MDLNGYADMFLRLNDPRNKRTLSVESVKLLRLRAEEYRCLVEEVRFAARKSNYEHRARACDQQADWIERMAAINNKRIPPGTTS